MLVSDGVCVWCFSICINLYLLAGVFVFGGFSVCFCWFQCLCLLYSVFILIVLASVFVFGGFSGCICWIKFLYLMDTMFVNKERFPRQTDYSDALRFG